MIARLLCLAFFAITAARAQDAPMLITRGEAEQLALKNNPLITAEHLLALAEGQTVREARSSELPQINGAVTAVKAEDGARIGAGDLTSSRLYTHAGAGGTLSQLITDFGRTPDLVASAKLRTKARQQNARATVEDVVFATDEAFYRLLEAQALLQVAQQTVQERSAVSEQIRALTASKLKSDLDLNIAAADVSQAQLLALDAQNEVATAGAGLAALMATPPNAEFLAVEPEAGAPAPPGEAVVLEKEALANRPDLAALNFSAHATEEFAQAQSKQRWPAISALATGGATPVRPDGGVFPQNWWGAAAVDLSLPLFTGFRISAETNEARYRAQAQRAQAANLANTIQRDVRVATLAAQTAFARIGVSEQFRAEARMALGLAQTRYQLGLSSIVELSQAQLQSTQAEVAAVNARYAYLLQLRSLDYARGLLVP